MDAETLAAEVLRISELSSIEQEPAIDALWKLCKAQDFPQKKPLLRELVKAQVNAERDEQREQKTQTEMVALAQSHFLLHLGKSVRIGHFTSECVNGHMRERLNMLSRPDFLLWTKYTDSAEQWLVDPSTAQYLGLICDPRKPNVWDNKLNLWRGFGIQPTEGNAESFVGYVTVILAQRNEDWANYILNWLAWVVQNPGERIGVALCLISARQGTGKGSLGNLLLTIFGSHGTSVSRSEQLTGHFNANLEGALFCFADEALFAGDLRGADAFKNIVTEPWMTITRKGVDSFNMENRLSILMATNHRFAAQVEWSDRRFAMFEVNEEPQTRAYWDAFHNWLNNGGKNIALNYLLTRDLSGWHPVDDRPMTPIYMDARRQSLRETHRWWHDVLEAESLAVGTGVPSPVLDEYGTIEKKTLYSLYKQWHRQNEHAASRAASQQVFWRDFWAMTQGKVGKQRLGKRGEQERAIFLPVIPSGDGAMMLPPGVQPSSVNWALLSTCFEDWLAQR